MPYLTFFIQVRLKRYLEMRGADGGPWRRLCALPAFWVMAFSDCFFKSSLFIISLCMCVTDSSVYMSLLCIFDTLLIIYICIRTRRIAIYIHKDPFFPLCSSLQYHVGCSLCTLNMSACFVSNLCKLCYELLHSSEVISL
jgi:hypothetical protein